MRASELPEGQPWLCTGCAAKDSLLDAVNEHFGTIYDLSTPWSEVFAEDIAAAAAGAGAGVTAAM